MKHGVMIARRLDTRLAAFLQLTEHDFGTSASKFNCSLSKLIVHTLYVRG